MAIFTVTTTADSGKGSLRQALLDSVTNGTGADNINFDASLSGQTIFLDNSLDITSGTVTINGDIDGDGAPDITISGDTNQNGSGDSGDVGVVVAISAGATAALKSLKISDGYHKGATSGVAGETGEDAQAGIVNNGTLSIVDSIISGHEAIGGASGYVSDDATRGADAVAGVVNGASSTLIVMDSVFAENEATGAAAAPADDTTDRGGNGVAGIQTYGDLQMNGVVMIDNIAVGGNGGFSGYIAGGRGGHGIVGVDQRDGDVNGIFGYNNSSKSYGAGGGTAYGIIGADGDALNTYQAAGTGSLSAQSLTAAQFGGQGADSATVGNNGKFFGLGGDDVIDNSAGQGYLYGGGGNDTITTRAASGKAFGGSGNDTIINLSTDSKIEMDGGTGIDLLDVSQDVGLGFNFTLNMKTGAASSSNLSTFNFIARNFENVIGNDDATVSDNITGTDGKNILKGLGGADTLKGEGGNDVLEGGNQNDILKGGDGKDTLRGGKDNDKLFGDASNDKLFGDKGKDTLKGGDGKDKLAGGKDNDKLTGGAGKDQFVFAKKEGKNTINDFENGKDKIDLSAFNFNNKSQALSKFFEIGNDHNDKIGFKYKGTEIVVKGIDMGDLNSGDIII